MAKGLYVQGQHTYLLDGDSVRHGLNRDLGFTDADRVESTRRMAGVARLIVHSAFISPFRSERQLARDLLEGGELQNFTGIDSAYETPKQPEMHLQTANMSTEEAADTISGLLD